MLAGALICHAKSNFLFHHKFCVIDKKLLITGSYNWRSHGAQTNWENLVVTSNAALVPPFTAEFNKLWRQFTNQSLDTLPNSVQAKFLPTDAWENIIVGHVAPFRNKHQIATE